MDFFFLFGTSGYPIRSPSYGSSVPETRQRSPKRPKTSATLWAPYGGEPLVPKGRENLTFRSG